jgi:hypothetical protein
MTAKINPSIGKLAVPIGKLHEDPKNARKHDERNIGWGAMGDPVQLV